jgi:hypothetical protein
MICAALDPKTIRDRHGELAEPANCGIIPSTDGKQDKLNEIVNK